jgi:hypothetical protein
MVLEKQLDWSAFFPSVCKAVSVIIYNFIPLQDHISGVMISVLSLSMVDRGFKL